MKLIFIESVSGVGKSTTTKKICDKLREMNFSVGYYLEGDFANPIDFFCTAYFNQDEYDNLLAEYNEFSDDIKANTIIADDIRLIRYYNRETPLFFEPLLNVLRKYEFCWNPINLVPISEYTRVYKSVWGNFARNVSNQRDYIIFDGSLLHHPINDMMRNYNASYNEIFYHVNTLIEAVNLLNPQIIYLSSDDVAERLVQARISRNQSPPSAEQILFWEKRKQMDMSVIRQLSITHDIYDISHDNWDYAIDVMINRITERKGINS